MILSYEVEDENLTPFEKFFLFEAPLEKPKRKNVKVIKVRGGSRGKDYTQMDEDESSDNSSEDTNNDTSDDNSDNTKDSEDNTDDSDNDEESEDNEDYTSDNDSDNTDDSDNDEESEDNEDYTSDNDSDNSDGGDNSDEEEDNEDYTSDGGDDDTGDDSDNDSSDSSEDEKNNKIEKLRKFNLFKDFIKLRGTLETYIEKLDSIVSDNNEINSLYKNVTNRFRTLNELIYDYMVIKFERNTYFKSFLFYQRVIATMQFNIDLLGKVKKKEQSLIKSKNNKLK